MWYNLTAVNASGVLPLLQSENTIFMQGFLGDILLVVIFVIAFRSMMFFNNNPKVNLLVCSFAVAIFSIFFKLLSLIQDAVVFICCALFAFAMLIYWFIS